MSIGLFFILGTWLIEGLIKKDLGSKFRSYFSSSAALAFSSIFFLALIGCLWSDDKAWASDQIRLLLPFLMLSVVCPGIPKFSRTELRTILALFIFSVLIVSIVGMCGASESIDGSDFRKLSPFISHIRMSLMAAMAIFSILWSVHFKEKWVWPVALATVAWLVFYLLEMHSIHGMSIVLIGVVVLLWSRASQMEGTGKLMTRIGILIVPLFVLAVLGFKVHQFYDVDPDLLAQLPERSTSGGDYFHDLEDPVIENGRYVYVNICYGELKKGWSERSEIPFNGNDEKGQLLHATLYRYMTSKDLRKDAEGLAQLTAEDIRNIESGVANVRIFSQSGIENRIEQLVFQLDRYYHTGDPSGNSFSMRLEFARTAFNIISRNLWIGVGTGDTRQAFTEEYDRIDTPLEEKYRFRAHDQYLTVLVSYGIIGFAIFIFAFLFPFTTAGLWRNGLALAFLLSVFISFLNDDTLERQAGVTYVAFFFSLLVFMKPEADAPA